MYTLHTPPTFPLQKCLSISCIDYIPHQLFHERSCLSIIFFMLTYSTNSSITEAASVSRVYAYIPHQLFHDRSCLNITSVCLHTPLTLTCVNNTYPTHSSITEAALVSRLYVLHTHPLFHDRSYLSITCVCLHIPDQLFKCSVPCLIVCQI